MMFGFIAKHRGIWPVALICEALGVSRSGFYALTRGPSARSRREEVLIAQIRSSFRGSDRTYGARRVWHDLLAAGIECGLHAVERLMRRNGLRARPRRRRLPIDCHHSDFTGIAHEYKTYRLSVVHPRKSVHC
jgi:putative transposase